jgi:hypothetical protein
LTATGFLEALIEAIPYKSLTEKELSDFSWL